MFGVCLAWKDHFRPLGDSGRRPPPFLDERWDISGTMPDEEKSHGSLLCGTTRCI